MRKLLLVTAAFATLALSQTQTFTYSYSGLPLPIYPDDWNTWSTLTVVVPRSMTITKVTVSTSVQYSGVGDLNVYLWSPAGTRTKLLERNCGSLQNIDTTFDDAAPTMFNSVCPQAGQGPFRGNEPLANSRNENAFGYWRFGVENNGSSNTGTLTAFSITITGTPLGPPAYGSRTIVSTSSFENGTVAPGDQLIIFGANLGPTTPLHSDSTKILPTALGGTSVTFDGIAAPIYFVSQNDVAVQAPVGLSAGSTTNIKVNSTAGSGSNIAMPVVTTKPGVFTYESLGKGQAKAINQDGSLNGDGSIDGTDKPAPGGSVLSVYATGLGTVSPAIPEGTPAPMTPLSTTALPVTATIGGEPATVTWAGASPGHIGTYQINILVPSRLQSGANRLVLSVGGNNSQSGVTVEIK